MALLACVVISGEDSVADVCWYMSTHSPLPVLFYWCDQQVIRHRWLYSLPMMHLHWNAVMVGEEDDLAVVPLDCLDLG